MAPPVSPTDDCRIKDETILKQLAHKGFRIILHGHLHRAANVVLPLHREPFASKIELIGAGTFGSLADKKEGRYPYQYHLIRVQGSKVRVDSRTRNDHREPWVPHAIYDSNGQDPNEMMQPFYEFDL